MRPGGEALKATSDSPPPSNESFNGKGGRVRLGGQRRAPNVPIERRHDPVDLGAPKIVNQVHDAAPS